MAISATESRAEVSISALSKWLGVFIVTGSPLQALLTAEEDVGAIGEAENGRQGVMMARKTPPDLVISVR